MGVVAPAHIAFEGCPRPRPLHRCLSRLNRPPSTMLCMLLTSSKVRIAQRWFAAADPRRRRGWRRRREGPAPPTRRGLPTLLSRPEPAGNARPYWREALKDRLKVAVNSLQPCWRRSGNEKARRAASFQPSPKRLRTHRPDGTVPRSRGRVFRSFLVQVAGSTVGRQTRGFVA